LQAYDPNSLDTRKFGDLVAAVIRDTDRPDLQNSIPDYIRDSIRYWSRKPLFFTELDNRSVPAHAVNLSYPQGSTVYVTVDGVDYILVALQAGTAGSVAPTWTSTLYAPTLLTGMYETTDPGVTVDGSVHWATVEAWPSTNGPKTRKWTELSTVPFVNSYVPPVDYVAPYLIELTEAQTTCELIKKDYRELRAWDMQRQTISPSRPCWYAFYQERIFVHPYPNGFYPLTLSYYTAPFPPRDMETSNFWTTKAERMVRKYACALIESEEIKDFDSATANFSGAQREYDLFLLQAGGQDEGGTPSSEW